MRAAANWTQFFLGHTFSAYSSCCSCYIDRTGVRIEEPAVKRTIHMSVQYRIPHSSHSFAVVCAHEGGWGVSSRRDSAARVSPAKLSGYSARRTPWLRSLQRAGTIERGGSLFSAARLHSLHSCNHYRTRSEAGDEVGGEDGGWFGGNAGGEVGGKAGCTTGGKAAGGEAGGKAGGEAGEAGGEALVSEEARRARRGGEARCGACLPERREVRRFVGCAQALRTQSASLREDAVTFWGARR